MLLFTVSRAHHCSQHKTSKPLHVSSGLWQLLTHLSWHSRPPIPTRLPAPTHRTICNSQRGPCSSVSWPLHALYFLKGSPFPSSLPLPSPTSFSWGTVPCSSGLSFWVTSLVKAFLTLYALTWKSPTFPSRQLYAWCIPSVPACLHVESFPGGSVGKNLPASAGDADSIPGSGRAPEEGNGNPLQSSCSSCS